MFFKKEITSLKKSFKLFLYTIKNKNKFKADPDKIKKRLDICRGSSSIKKCDEIDDSENILFIKKDKCSICGCYLKIKTKLDFERCPLNKW